MRAPTAVVPAKAGTQGPDDVRSPLTPAFAGVTRTVSGTKP